ncbi:YDG domain-containing protein [Comamonas aquatilis]
MVAVKGTGDLTINSPAASFGKSLTLDSAYDFGSTHSSITIGNTTNSADVSLTSALAANGPISVYGGNVTTSAALTSTAANADVLLKATAGVTVGSAITTNAGDITLWSNSTDATTGGISVLDNVTLDSRRNADRTAGNTSTASGGGAITLGGGSASAALASGTVVPIGYASNRAAGGAGVLFGTAGNGHNANDKLYSGGGDISVSGQSTAAKMTVDGLDFSIGVAAFEGLTMDAGTSGSITLVGNTSFATTVGQGIEIGLSDTGLATSTLRTANGNISLTGTASGATTVNNGIQIRDLTASRTTLVATGTGGISLTGNGSVAGSRDLNLGGIDILAASGPITITGTGSGYLNTQDTSGVNYQMNVGSKAGSPVTGSSSNIVVTDDSFVVAANNGFAFNTSGTVTLQPYTNNFSTAFNLSPNTFASTVSALTVGKDIGATAHTDTVNMNAAANIAGPISVYAGTITTSAALSSSNVGADILLKSTGLTTVGGSITTNAGDITVWSNATDASAGGLNVLDNVTLDTRRDADRTAGNIATASGGGTVTLGGGSASITLPSSTVVPTGYAQTTTLHGGVVLGTDTNAGHNSNIKVYSGGGNITMRGRNTSSAPGSVAHGLMAYGGLTMDGGTTGAITLDGNANVVTNSVRGIELNYNGGTATLLRTTDGNINITGTAAGSTGISSAVQMFANPSAGSITLAATGTGGVSITGNGTTSGSSARNFVFNGTDILAASGPITFNGTAAGGIFLTNVNGTAYQGSLGAKAGSLVTAFSSNITLTNDNFAVAAGVGFNFNTSGAAVIQSFGDNFSTAFNLSPLTFASSVSSLTVGKDIGATAHTDTVNMNAAVNIAGPISVYGGNITTSAALQSNKANADILLKATNGVQVGGNITTNAGDITLWSNATDATAGGIYVLDNTQFDTRTQADRTAGNTSTASGGGAITLGGGSASTTLASGTVVPTGYALDFTGRGAGIMLGTDVNAASSHNANVRLLSGGGDVSLRGKAVNSRSSFFTSTAGIAAQEGLQIDGGTTGDITMDGVGAATIARTVGVNLSWNLGSGSASTVLRTHNGNIDLSGTGSQSPNSLGLYLLAGSATPTTIAATGSGSVSLTGAANNSSNAVDILLVGTDLLAASGPITITGRSNGSLRTDHASGQSAYQMSVGSKAGSLVGSSSSNIVVSENAFAVAAGDGLTFNTSGIVTLQSYANDFSTAFSLNGMGFASTVSALTVGRNLGATGHADTVNLNADVNIAGPISAYGGTITTSAALASNNAGADILLKATNGVQVGGNITSNAGDITLWSNSTGVTTGGIYVLDKTTLDTRGNADRTAGNTSTASGGGAITLGGGSASTTLASGTLVPAGFAQNLTGHIGAITLGTDTGSGHDAMVSLVSGGGDISLRGQTTSTAGNFASGISAYEGLNIDAGSSGSIALVGNSSASTTTSVGVNLGANRTGAAASVLRSGNGNIALSGTASGGATGSNVGVSAAANSSGRMTLAATGSGAISISGNASDASGSDVRLANADLLAASGPITVTGSGAGALATAAYGTPGTLNLGAVAGGLVTASTSNITISENDFAVTGSNGFAVTTSGAVTLQPFGSNFTTPFVLSRFGFSSTVSGLTVGKDIGSVAHTDTIGGAGSYSIAGPISLYAGTINLGFSLTSTAAGGTITLSASNAAAQSTGRLEAANLLLLGSGNFTLNQPNLVGILATGSDIGSLSLLNGSALTIGSVAGSSGINSTGTVNVATTAGNLTVAQNVTTTSSASDAITLNAGKNASAGTATGGNLIVSGSPAITTGAGGRATLYSGSATADSSLAALIGRGSGRFRYNSDEATTNYTAALGTGLYGIYRQSMNTAFALGDISTVYGTAATLNTANALVNGDAATFSIANPLLSTSGNMRVGSYGINVTNLSALTALGYTATGNSSATLTVTAKALSIGGITAGDKVYDGSRNATISTSGATYTGLVSGDVVTFSSSGSFGDKNVANGKTVTLVNTNGGADAGNYTITNQATTTASITPKTLTVSQITAADKVYDGTAAANVVTGSVQYTGLVVNDDVKLVSSTGVFGNKHAGNGKTVTLSNSYSGTDKGNYLIVDQTSTQASISQAQLQISTNDVTKVYDGTTAVFGGAAMAVGGTQLFGGDTLTGGTFADTSKNVGIGNKVVVGVTGATINDGNSGGNYAVSYVNNTNSTITAKALSIGGITAADKVYDGNTNASVSTAGATFNGLVAGDKVTVSSSGSFGDKNVANGKTVTLVNTNGGADAGNYTITNQATTTASITPKTLTVSQITAADKVYDGTAAANVVTGSVQYTGLVVNDDVKLVSSTGVFGNKHAGNGKTVTLSNSYSGTDKGNYLIVDQTSTQASISQAQLQISTNDVTKVYDGTTAVFGGAAMAVGGTQLFGGDTLTGGNFAYADKNAGAGSKMVTVSGVSVSDGNSGGNYAVSYVNNTGSTINKAALTVNGITAADKVYDGNTNVLVSTAGLNYTGLLAGDQVTTDVSGQFVDRNAGIGKTVTLLSSYGGTDVGNYLISSQASANATISKAGLTVTANDDARFVTRSDIAGYNGVHYSGFVGGDTAASLDLSGLVVNRPNAGINVGAGVYAGALQASGVSSGNYSISYAAGNYTILAANNALVKTVNQETSYGTVPTYTVASVEYMDNNNLISTLMQSGHSGNSYSYSDGAGGTLSFALGPRTPNLSSSGLVSVGNYTIADANPVIGGGNLAGAVTFIGNLAVQAKAVSVSAGGVSKIYDGTTAMNGVTLNLSGQFGGDTVTVNGRGNFSQKNVGNNLSYSVTDMALDGADGANYYLSGGSSLSGNNGSITPKTITVGGITAADKVYDAGKSATVNTSGANYGGLITGDDVGVIATGLFGDKNVGQGKTVTLSSSYSGADKGNYIFIDQASTTAAITPKALTVSGLAVANRTYDGTTGATVDIRGATYTGLIAGDFVQVAATGSFANKNAGANKLATLNSTYSGDDVGNYSITSQASTTGDIFAAALSVSSGNVSKVYDGNTSAAGSATVVGGQLFAGDTLSGGSFAFSNKNAGSGNKTVHVSGATLADGNNGGNYLVTYVDNTTSTITPKGVTVSGITGVDKVYDAGLGATVNTSGANYGGLITGDDVGVIATGLFGDKNVGQGKTVTLSSSYSGADKGNYIFIDQASTTAAITPKALTVSGLAVANRTYDGTTGATVDIRGVTYTGLIAGDFVQVAATGSFANKNAGADKLATLNSTYSGDDVGNYSITSQASTTGDIFAAALSVSSGNVSKVYDGNTSAAGSATVVGGQLFAGETLSGGSFAFSNKNAGSGNKTVHVSGATLADGNNGGNYLVTYVDNTTSTITPKGVTVSGITGVDKVYDAGLGATVNTAGSVIGGLVSGDDVTVIATGLFGDKNVGQAKTVPLSSRYSGADIANYVFTDQASTTAAITPKALTVSGLAVANRTYDGTTGATVDIRGATYTGLIAGDFVQVAATGSFANKNAGADKLATLNSTYSGDDVGNYSITSQASTTGDITPASITVTVGNVSKVYDGMTSVSGATALLASGMLFGSDALTGGSLAFADKNAGAGNKTVLVGGFGVSDGNSGGNYTVSYLNNTTSTITPKALTVSGIAGVDRVYDGTIQAGVDTSALVLGGLISGDNLQLVSSAGNFTDKNAGQGKTVTLANSYSGADLGNYQITDQTGTTASIKQRMVSLSGQPDIGDLSKVYDGTTHVNIDTSGVTIGGLLTGDKLGYQASGTTADKNVGVDKNLTVVGGLTGEDAGNYQIEVPTTLSGKVTVTAKVLTLDGITASNKVYDRTTDATLGLADAVFSGAIEGDNVGYTASGAFSDKNAGMHKTVFLNTGLSGADAGNYTLSGQATTTADITARIITIDNVPGSGGDLSKVYDGTTHVNIDTSGVTIGGLLTGDSLGYQASGTTADKNVGVDKNLTIVGGLTGEDAGNYQIELPTLSGKVTVTPKILTVDGTVAQDKVFDGNTGAILSGATLTGGGVLGADDVRLLNQTQGSFDTASVGNGKTVSSAMTLGGDDAGNYQLSQPGGLVASITPQPVQLPPDVGVPPVLTPEAPRPPGFVPEQPVGGTDVLTGAPQLPALPGLDKTPTVVSGQEARSDVAPGREGFAQGALVAESVAVLMSVGDAVRTGDNFISVTHFEVLSLRPATPFTFALPKDTFVHSNSAEPLSIEARLADGQPLPSWLRFDVQGWVFSGMPPEGSSALDVVVIARDASGHRAQTQVQLSFH